MLLSFSVFSQTSDNFEDGNFTQNPEWIGNQSLFMVNTSHQLQLNDDAANQAYLSTSNTMMIDAEWQCWIKLAFSPSANNYARYYIASNKHDLTQPLFGYFLQFGESGSNDAVELFRQDGEIITSICRSSEGIISSSFEIRVKVTRSENGIWKLYVDKLGGTDFTLEAEGVDDTYTQTLCIGYLCKYTQSNSSKMYFDDVYAGPFIIDTEPPILLTAVADSDSTMQLQFNELLNEGSVVNANNYLVNNSMGYPDVAIRDLSNPSIINLRFSNKFEIGSSYLLSVTGVKDLAENEMNPQQMEFNYYYTMPYDIVINEIMADPTPVVALPEFEYVELYNQTQTSINLDGWSLTIGTSEKIFSTVILPAHGYLIIAKETAQEELSSYGLFYGFSTFSLTNSKQTITLKSENETIISKVSYSNSWYNNPEKADGGWSLEQINPMNVCSGGENWEASINNRGGTPGEENSVSSSEFFFPKLEQFEVVDKNSVLLYFSQSMDEMLLNNNQAYSVNLNIGNPEYVFTFDDEPNKVELYFSNPFLNNESYELQISKSLANCMQLNLSADTSVFFGLPSNILPNDVVINEILTNPWSDGVDYVELYNRSNKIIDLSTLQIGTVKISPPNPPDTANYIIIDYQKLLMPQDYILLSVSPFIVKSNYYTSNPEAFVKVDPFPSYNNDDGEVLLSTIGGEIIDSVKYSEEMQFPLLVYSDGVALERINPNGLSGDVNNWHSAAESVGFGTPGYKNSQFVSDIAVADDNKVVIEPEIFSPNNDGVDDVISIKYNFDTPGYVMTVTIFDASGNQIKKLINNEYLGTTGSVSWNGIQDDNSKAPIGIYVFYITVFDVNGNVKKYKKVGVLAAEL